MDAVDAELLTGVVNQVPMADSTPKLLVSWDKEKGAVNAEDLSI